MTIFNLPDLGEGLPDAEIVAWHVAVGDHLKLDQALVSVETAKVVTEALEIFELSGGAFDITVGPLVDLWGFGPSKQKKEIPSPSSIESGLELAGSEHLR